MSEKPKPLNADELLKWYEEFWQGTVQYNGADIHRLFATIDALTAERDKMVPVVRAVLRKPAACKGALADALYQFMLGNRDMVMKIIESGEAVTDVG